VAASEVIKDQGSSLAKRASSWTSPIGANLGFEATLWLAADKLHNNMDAAEYKDVVLGLIFFNSIGVAVKVMYGYPTDKQEKATKTVREQAGVLSLKAWTA